MWCTTINQILTMIMFMTIFSKMRALRLYITSTMTTFKIDTMTTFKTTTTPSHLATTILLG